MMPKCCCISDITVHGAMKSQSSPRKEGVAAGSQSSLNKKGDSLEGKSLLRRGIGIRIQSSLAKYGVVIKSQTSQRRFTYRLKSAVPHAENNGWCHGRPRVCPSLFCSFPSHPTSAAPSLCCARGGKGVGPWQRCLEDEAGQAPLEAPQGFVRLRDAPFGKDVQLPPVMRAHTTTLD